METINWYDQNEKLHEEVKAHYLKTVGKNDPNLEYFNAFCAGYYQSLAASVLYWFSFKAMTTAEIEDVNKKGMEFFEHRIKYLRNH